MTPERLSPFIFIVAFAEPIQELTLLLRVERQSLHTLKLLETGV